MSREGDMKIQKDLEDTKFIISQMNLLVKRIESASEKILSGGNGNGNRPKPA